LSGGTEIEVRLPLERVMHEANEEELRIGA